MALSKDFLWGGALAAHQFEGGVLNTSKGYSVADVMTAGAHGVPRRITDQIMENEYYPNHVGIDFYSHYKEDIALFAEMGFKCFRSHGLVFSLMVMKQNPMKKDYNSMMMFLMNY